MYDTEQQGKAGMGTWETISVALLLLSIFHTYSFPKIDVLMTKSQLPSCIPLSSERCTGNQLVNIQATRRIPERIYLT